nr:hypothetical protein [Tanacetum cinerariifolium]
MLLKHTKVQGEEVSHTVALEERTIELDEGQARSVPGKIPKSRPPPEREFIEEDQARSNPRQSHVGQTGPNLEPMHENCIDTVYPERFVKISMKEILHDRMFESGSYRSHLDHTTLYEALKASMKCKNNDELYKALTTSLKRSRDDLDPIPPPPKDSDRSKKKKRDSNASSSKQPLLLKSSAWKTFDTREAPSSSSKQKPDSPSVQPIDLMNPEGNRVMYDISKPFPLGGPPVPSLWTKSENANDISSAYGISHWWLKRKEFYIARHSASSDSNTVRSHMKILSVISLKTFSRYGYTYLKEIILRKANQKEYKISEANFKNLHPNDFEDLYLLNLQGKLNHLSRAKKVHLSTTFNLWTRNIVIRQRTKDLQLGSKSYQTKLNLTQPRWDATDFLFKEDYTIVHKPRDVIYRDRNNQKKMMRETKMHKFSDSMLTRILEKLDYTVKDYELFKFNLGMENKIWTEDDKQRSQEFIKLIERRLKIRQIFRSLKSFVSGRLRDIDYRLIQRTE